MHNGRIIPGLFMQLYKHPAGENRPSLPAGVTLLRIPKTKKGVMILRGIAWYDQGWQGGKGHYLVVAWYKSA